LHEIQENLFIIQAQIASIMLDNNFKAPKFKNEKIKEIEKIIDEIETKLPPLRNFIISGTGKTSAWLDWLRAKSRSVERSVLKIKNSKINIFSNILPYLNRLSSLFFALARLEARNKKEQHPKYE
jgi:cob(I)alamin adenosyltransferase